MEMELMLIVIAALCVVCVIGFSAVRLFYARKLSAMPEDPELPKMLELLDAVKPVPVTAAVPLINAAYPGVPVKEYTSKKAPTDDGIVFYKVSNGKIRALTYNDTSVATR